MSKEDDCKNGVYRKLSKAEGGRCYTYRILESICLMVAFEIDPKTSSYHWEYKGGCYGDKGSIAHYIEGEIGQKYNFVHVPIEVR